MSKIFFGDFQVKPFSHPCILFPLREKSGLRSIGILPVTIVDNLFFQLVTQGKLQEFLEK